MKTEVKLWPLKGEQGFNSIWASVLFDPTRLLFQYDQDIIKTNILV